MGLSSLVEMVTTGAGRTAVGRVEFTSVVKSAMMVLVLAEKHLRVKKREVKHEHVKHYCEPAA